MGKDYSLQAWLAKDIFRVWNPPLYDSLLVIRRSVLQALHHVFTLPDKSFCTLKLANMSQCVVNLFTFPPPILRVCWFATNFTFKLLWRWVPSGESAHSCIMSTGRAEVPFTCHMTHSTLMSVGTLRWISPRLALPGSMVQSLIVKVDTRSRYTLWVLLCLHSDMGQVYD